MALTSSFYSAVSSLNATSTGFSVIGDNLANTNTVGFKNSRAMFGNMLKSKMDEIGNGVGVVEIQPQFKQGDLQTSSNPLDFAIEGNGFFVLKDPAQANLQRYTRSGSFSFDKTYSLVTPKGLNLQGYLADASGNIGTTVSNIQLKLDPNGNATIQPQQSTKASLQVNLSANDSAPASAWLLDPSKGPAKGSYNYVSTMRVYDSYYEYDKLTNSIKTNQPHNVDVYFEKTGNLAWNAHIVCNTGKTTNNYQEQAVPLTFDTKGNLTSPGTANITLGWNPAWKAASQTISLDFSKSTQYGTPNAMGNLSVDGYADGGLTNLRSDSKGILYGGYSNGQERKIAQIVLAQFKSPTELKRLTNNIYASSSGSGQAKILAPGSGGAGSVLGNTLEASNVDMAEEFANMITLQRAFQANTTVISATNEMFSTLTNIKK